jgi:hypothetical protein
MFQKHTGLPTYAFYSQDGSPTGYDPGDLNAVTIEAENLPLTSIIISSLNSNGSYIQYGGALSSGDVVNVYLVYLNHNSGTNWRSSNLGYVTFSNEILGVYTGHSQTLHFTGSDYSSSYYPSTASNKRSYEPSNGDSYAVTNSNKTFTMRCKNGAKGDFFRVVTRTTCSEPTGSGSIGNPQNNCGSFDPATITNSSSGSGGSGGTETYFWQYSTSSSSGPWTTIGSSNSSTYNPSSISQTTWYRRGYYRCDISAAIYTPTIEKTVITEPTVAGTIANPESNCGSFNPGNIWYNTLASGGSGGTPTYFWEKSTTNSSSGFSTISGVSTFGYDPPSTITQTTWYRRGAYRCDISAAIYTSAIEKTVNSVPSAPTTGSVTQPTCATSTGSFQINGYNASNTYVFTPSVASTSGSGLVTANAGTYTFTVTNAVGCISSASSNITVNAQPATPSAPVAGAIQSQQFCAPWCIAGQFASIIFANAAIETERTGIPTLVNLLVPSVCLLATSADQWSQH